MPPLTIEALADSLRANFIGHAAGIPHEQWRERWLWINRAAGIIVGAALALADHRDRPEEIAMDLWRQVVAEFPNDPTFNTFADGLEERIIKCLLALDGRAAAADLLKHGKVRALHAELQRQKGAAR